MLGKELDRIATEIAFSAPFWENKPQHCSFSLGEKLKCFKGVIMEKSESLPAFCNHKGQSWEEGFGGDHLLLCSQHEHRGSEIECLFDGEEERENYLAKTAPWSPAPYQ